ncbi:MAG: 16S rRNA (cytosine(967)-C(5))-methyltransferase RsmB [Thioalkalispiraceae bacterium]|jgi:16S rRNA (cytosine967-C5)-methyltransferase
MKARLAALNILRRVIEQGNNLPDAINKTPSDNPALSQAMSYGVIRHYQSLDFYLQQLVKKPLRNKDRDIALLIMLGLYQLSAMRIPDHAAVSETVKICKALKKDWARNLVNGVLRQFQRQQSQLQDKLQQHETACYDHPQWLIDQLKSAWPEQWQAVLLANNQLPPMTLRVNTLKTTREDYRQQLEQAGIKSFCHPHAPEALILETPCEVEKLPGFADGACSVQDAAAQLAAHLLGAQAGETILDACAAPGGKTAHILEQQPGLNKLLALDIAPQRLENIADNLARLSLRAELCVGDAIKPGTWWDGQAFDRILLDAPCSASGVIRRHPDIKLLRRPEDLPELIEIQQQILDQLWPLLKPGGMLVYATCSILPQENTQQVEHFLARQPGAIHKEIDADWGHQTTVGRQILPGEEGMDGFFYAQLYKQA